MASTPATYIIDGYNLIRHVLSAEELAGGLETARRILEARLRAFRGCRGRSTRIFLVYDGESGFVSPRAIEKGLEVHFSRPPATADDVILALARKMEGRSAVEVVTSDAADIGDRIRNLRLSVRPSREFAALVRRALGAAGAGGQRDDEAAGRPESISRTEVDRWVREFGFGPDSGEDDREGGWPAGGKPS